MRKPSPVTVLGGLALGLGLSLAACGTASADIAASANAPASRSPGAHLKAHSWSVARTSARPARTGSSPAPVGGTAARAAKATLPADPFADAVSGVTVTLKRLFCNQAPTIAAQGSGHQLANGAIWDYLHSADPEGDAVRYTLDQAPRYGSVAVSADGTYVYTPGNGFTGADTFVVGVDEAEFHLNLLDFFGDRHSQAPVTVHAGDGDAEVIVLDDFDGAAGSRPNSALWNYETGKGVGDGLQNYTDSTDNVRLDGQGHLVIQARPVSGGYTSGLLTTKGKLDMMYGTLTARIEFPAGQGIWPAFWMLGSTFSRATWNAPGAMGWPGCGEIDIMELANTATTYHVTLHGPNAKGGDFSGAPYWQPVGTTGPTVDLSAGFHDYWITREPDLITIGMDGTVLATFTPASVPAGGWVFNAPMFAILNVAVGGPWPGPPNSTTPWPATMLVDSFRYTSAV